MKLLGGHGETTRGGSKQGADGIEAAVAAEPVVGVRGTEKPMPTTRELTSSTASHSTVSLSSYTISSGGSDSFLGDSGRKNSDGYRPTASVAPPTRHRHRGSELSGSR